ncbi:MAG TPA: PDZ domain-containing protein [Bacteroidales bacterium]|jgi:predicted metalloprotease with PDZ domain|nr:PDZ domain-containing protein [Bacteroidales bacterium]
MNRRLSFKHHRILAISLFVALSLAEGFNDRVWGSPGSTIEYTISMENPNNHYFHISLYFSGLKDDNTELKMPVWTPGYYMIMDYPKNVLNFRVTEASGKELLWKKTAKNRWKINTAGVKSIHVSYDVYAFRVSVADSFLDDGRGFISPTGIYMYPAGGKDHPVTVTVKPYEKFKEVSTGLDPVPGKEHTYYAPDFDVLYDCPILAGNQEILKFETGGIPYTIAAENLGNLSRTELVNDFRKIVETATAVIGEIPYRHYTFIMMNNGMGGLEHTNSMAVFTNRLNSESGRVGNGWLSFIAHEFFHLYNVKTIRPIDLGPFDYDRENYTTMLWFSEGVTSYYENLILNRAGFFTRDDVFKEMSSSVAAYENIPGRLFQSVSESSFDSWLFFLNRSENAANTTISYYDKGCAIGMLLDLKIRYESGNKKSLDDVMRTLYNTYYKGKKRGFTDKEFREVCEKTAGTSLNEIFDSFIPTTEEIDYKKYLAYAGLTIDTEPVESDGYWIGADVCQNGDNVVISRVERDSPAWEAGLSSQDIITEINGQKATMDLFNDTLLNAADGNKILFKTVHRDISNESAITPVKKLTINYNIHPASDISPVQGAILSSWLK